jgi:hypothetical protein
VLNDNEGSFEGHETEVKDAQEEANEFLCSIEDSTPDRQPEAGAPLQMPTSLLNSHHLRQNTSQTEPMR